MSSGPTPLKPAAVPLGDTQAHIVPELLKPGMVVYLPKQDWVVCLTSERKTLEFLESGGKKLSVCGTPHYYECQQLSPILKQGETGQTLIFETLLLSWGEKIVYHPEKLQAVLVDLEANIHRLSLFIDIFSINTPRVVDAYEESLACLQGTKHRLKKLSRSKTAKTQEAQENLAG